MIKKNKEKDKFVIIGKKKEKARKSMLGNYEKGRWRKIYNDGSQHTREYKITKIFQT